MTNTNKQRIHLSIGFGDAILPIIECEDGHQRVPLKPIVEQIGAQWEGQRRRVQPDKYLGQRLGTLTTPLQCGDVPHLCIRLDRVTAFLNTINPENVRGKGNHDTADWLEAKHQEWDDALHQYETAGFAVNKSHYSNREAKEKGYRRMVFILREKNKIEDAGDRRLIASIIKDMAEAQGLNYQTDLLDDQQQSA